MYQKSTGELEKQLENLHPSEIRSFADQNKGEVLHENRDFMEYMNARLKEKGLLKQDVLLQADISQGYGYKLLTEEKVTRQRDIILRICYAAEFTLAETQQALKIYHMDTLYASDLRDALIMTCFNERPGTVLEINELLLANKMKPLRSSGSQD